MRSQIVTSNYEKQRSEVKGERVEPISALIPHERIERAILLVRGQKVILDKDLAALYGVATKVLVQAVKRNINRFPADFYCS